MRECPTCEFPLEAMGVNSCPKCDYSGGLSSTRVTQGLLEIDIAHAGETWEHAKYKLDQALDDALYYHHAGVRVIHGYGSNSGGRAVIGPRAQSYLRTVAERYNGRYAQDRNTQGVSIVWFNR